jgi:hypothetical protein
MPTLSIDTTLLTNVCTWVGKAHNTYLAAVGDETHQSSPTYWVETVKSYVRGGNDVRTGMIATAVTVPGAPTLATATGSTLGVGAYKYQLTFVVGGETSGGTEASITTTSGNTNVNLTAIPLGPTGCTARGVYRTAVGGATGTEKLVAYINDNTSTTYTDSLADGSLGAAIPTSNLSGTPTVAAQGSPNNTVNITGGSVQINGIPVAVATNATYGSSTIFTQTCTDGSPLTAGQFYDAAICVDHKGTLAVFRGPREDIANSNLLPPVPTGYCILARARINYQAGATVIQSADLVAGPILTAFAGSTNDAAARIFADFDAGQTNLISRKAVKAELGFAMTSLDNYVKTITASQGLGTNGAGLSFLAWAKSTHQTTTPWDFPIGFEEFVRYLKNGKDASQRLGTIVFTGSGTATVTDLKKVLGLQDQLELVVVSAGGTGSAASTITVTTQSYLASSAVIWQATVPANSPNGTVIKLASSGTAALQTPLAGTSQQTAITASPVLSAQPAGTYVPSTRIWTALVPTSPVTVVGGTSGDSFAVRNTGVL